LADEQPGGKEGKPAVRVIELPGGGGVQIIIGEGGEGQDVAKAAKAAEKAAQVERRRAEVDLLGNEVERDRFGRAVWAKKIAVERQGGTAGGSLPLGDRLRRQKELSDQAVEVHAKWEKAMAAGQEGAAHELWERLDSIQREVRKVCQPAPAGFIGERPVIRRESSVIRRESPVCRAAPGTPAAVTLRNELVAKAKEMKEKAAQLATEGKTKEAELATLYYRTYEHAAEQLRRQQPGGPGEPLKRPASAGGIAAPSGRPGEPLNIWANPGQPANPFAVRPADPGVQQLRGEVQDLRNQVREIKELLKKMSGEKAGGGARR
jgi:hypothetical protein